MNNLIYKLIALIVLVFSFAVGAYWYQYNTYLQAPLSLGSTLNYEVKPGDNLTRIIYNLHKEGVVTQPSFLLWYARWNVDANAIHVGEYELSPAVTGQELVNIFVSGKVKQYAFTIIEGWTFEEMVEKLKSQDNLKHVLPGVTNKRIDSAAIMRELGYTGVHPEGRFMPDTYHYTRSMTDIQLLQRAYVAMEDYLQSAWLVRAKNIAIQSPYEALILASIIEKETGVVSERQTISGVFSRRLKKRMRLQTDPTVIYGMGDRYKGNIRRKDLKRDTPYNTYTRFGLPPTPIALPSREAIDAALHPDNESYLYFVAKGNGSHYFSDTLDEHNNAVIKYQLKGKKRSFSSSKNTPQKKH